MARSTTRNFQAALRYYFANNFGFIQEIGNVSPSAHPNSSNVYHDLDNDKALSWADSTDTFSIPALSVDANGVILVDKSAEKGCRGSEVFYLQANGGLATQTFFIADRTMLITGIEYTHATAGTDGSAVTAQVFHDTGVQAPGGGISVMSNTFNCKGTINTVQNATLNAVDGSGAQNASLYISAGDRLSVVFTGTLTTLAGVTLTVYTGPGLKEEVAVAQMNANSLITTQGIFLANRDMTITGVSMIWSAPGTNGGTVTMDVTHETSTTAPGSGTSILTAAQSVKGAANTVVNPALTATVAQLQLLAGDRLSLKTTGTLTGLAGLVVCVYMQADSDVVGTSLPYYGQVDANYSLKANGSLVTEEFFIADRDYEVVDVSEVHSTAGSDGGSVTIDVQIDKGTTAPGSGTSVLGTTFNAKGTANTVQYAGDGTITLTTARRKRLLSQGDRLCVVYTGVLTALVGVDVTVSLVPR